MKIWIRRMELEDIDQVLEVERASFQSPWTTDIYYHELMDNIHAHYYVAETEDHVVAFGGMWVVMEDAQITNIAVHPDFRGKKIGEKLFGYMLSTAIRMGAERLSLEVRKSNIVAQKMYQKFGLIPGGIRKNYYTDNQEDAIVMWVNFK